MFFLSNFGNIDSSNVMKKGIIKIEKMFTGRNRAREREKIKQFHVYIMISWYVTLLLRHGKAPWISLHFVQTIYNSAFSINPPSISNRYHCGWNFSYYFKNNSHLLSSLGRE